MIRPLRIRDLLVLNRIQQSTVRFNLPDSLIRPPSPSAAALVQIWPWRSFDPHCYVYIDKGKLLALVQAESRPRRTEWDVVALHSTYGESDACRPINHDLWMRLLEYLCAAAGQKGVKRLFARVPDDVPEFRVFRDLGFYSYSHEQILFLHKAVHPPFPEGSIRPQRGNDNWNIQRLYTASTPRAVQEAEAATSGQWDINRSGLAGRVKEMGYVWEEDHQVLAYLRMTVSRGARVMSVLSLPGRSDLLEPLLQYGLAILSDSTERGVYCSVREYQEDLESVLLDNGFEPHSGQSLLVKHTTVRVKGWRREKVSARDKKLCVTLRAG